MPDCIWSGKARRSALDFQESELFLLVVPWVGTGHEESGIIERCRILHPDDGNYLHDGKKCQIENQGMKVWRQSDFISFAEGQAAIFPGQDVLPAHPAREALSRRWPPADRVRRNETEIPSLWEWRCRLRLRRERSPPGLPFGARFLPGRRESTRFPPPCDGPPPAKFVRGKG